MNIEEAKEYLRNYKYDNEVSEAIETVLSELEKKDKVINEMAKHITGYSNIDVKEYFTNKVEREGK